MPNKPLATLENDRNLLVSCTLFGVFSPQNMDLLERLLFRHRKEWGPTPKNLSRLLSSSRTYSLRRQTSKKRSLHLGELSIAFEKENSWRLLYWVHHVRNFEKSCEF